MLSDEKCRNIVYGPIFFDHNFVVQLIRLGIIRYIFGCFVCKSLAIVVTLQRVIYNNVYEEVRFGPSSHLGGAVE